MCKCISNLLRTVSVGTVIGAFGYGLFSIQESVAWLYGAGVGVILFILLVIHIKEILKG